MNVKTLATSVVATVILIVLASAVLIPIVSDAQKVAGDTTSRTNPIVGPYKLLDKDSRVEIDITYSGGITVSVNGDDYVMTDVTNANVNILISDAMTINRNANGTNVSIATAEGDGLNSHDKHIVFDNGTVTYEIPATSYTWAGEYTWVYVLDQNGEYGNRPGTSNMFVNSINDVVASGYYGSGDNDCYYDLKDGVVSNSEGYECSVTYDLAPVPGTTDIYELSNLKLLIGGEEFTPYRVLVEETIYGHKDSGATYSLIGIIPLLIFTGLVIGVVGSFIRNRD